MQYYNLIQYYNIVMNKPFYIIPIPEGKCLTEASMPLNITTIPLQKLSPKFPNSDLKLSPCDGLYPLALFFLLYEAANFV